jgi:hypothetical protein
VITIRATVPEDLPLLSALFEDRFGHGLTTEEWHWKYQQLPGMGRSVVAVTAEGNVLAHAGAIGLPAAWNAGPGTAWQLVDFVAARTGGGLRPPLVDLGRHLLGDLPSSSAKRWIFGFPSPRHFRLGERVFGYRPLLELQPLAADLSDREPPPGAWLEVADSVRDGSVRAWAECGAHGVKRTASFLNWRYYARPVRYYRFYRLASATGGGEGLAVFAFVGTEAWAAELWLPDSGEWYPSMLAIADDLRRSGLTTWRFWPPVSEEGRKLLAVLGLRDSGEPVFVGCRPQAGEDPQQSAAGFTYSMGDYDVV